MQNDVENPLCEIRSEASDPALSQSMRAHNLDKPGLFPAPRLADIHRVATRFSGSRAYGIAYSRPWGPGGVLRNIRS